MQNISDCQTKTQPIVPSFNNKEASTIEPETGASTCALGNQRWRKNKGVFAIKTMVKPRVLNKDNGPLQIWRAPKIGILKNKIKNKRGKEKRNMYNTRYKTDGIFSGW